VGLGKRGKKILKSGESYTVVPYKHHYFFNPTDKEIKFKIELKPGHEGFENSLRIIYGLAEDGLTNRNGIPKSIQNKAILACMGDVNLPGFFSLIFPLLRRIAKKAAASGDKQRLVDRYCLWSGKEPDKKNVRLWLRLLSWSGIIILKGMNVFWFSFKCRWTEAFYL